MRFDAFAVLLIAAVLSGVLAVSHVRGGTATLGWGGGVLHGVTGCAGLVALLVGFAGPPHVEVMGVGGFGRAATVLLALALLAGLAIVLTLLRRRRVPGLLIGIHAKIAVSRVVILAAYALVGTLAVPG
jgi:hypothetical protein